MKIKSIIIIGTMLNTVFLLPYLILGENVLTGSDYYYFVKDWGLVMLFINSALLFLGANIDTIKELNALRKLPIKTSSQGDIWVDTKHIKFKTEGEVIANPRKKNKIEK